MKKVKSIQAFETPVGLDLGNTNYAKVVRE